MSVESGAERTVHPRWSDAVCREKIGRTRESRAQIGVLPGEGIGPEVIGAALEVLDAARSAGGADIEIRTGGTIGRDAELMTGRPLTEEVAEFCSAVFEDGGVVLCGPGGGRFVYDLRRRFDLYCKISPLKPVGGLLEAGPLKARCVEGVDILIVRENVGGVYQGEWRETAHERDGRVCEHAFRYSEVQVRRLLEAAASLAARAQGQARRRRQGRRDSGGERALARPRPGRGVGGRSRGFVRGHRPGRVSPGPRSAVLRRPRGPEPLRRRSRRRRGGAPGFARHVFFGQLLRERGRRLSDEPRLGAGSRGTGPRQSRSVRSPRSR